MASGNTLLIFTAHAGNPPASNYATLDTRNSHLVLEFDAATAESIVFNGILPRNYAGGGLTVTIVWMADTATTGDVMWGASIERHDDEGLDLDADSFAAEKTVASTAPGTSGMVQYCAIAFTTGAEMDSLAAAESFRLKIRRVAADAGDTMAGDAQLVAVEIRET